MCLASTVLFLGIQEDGDTEKIKFFNTGTLRNTRVWERDGYNKKCNTVLEVKLRIFHCPRATI